VELQTHLTQKKGLMTRRCTVLYVV